MLTGGKYPLPHLMGFIIVVINDWRCKFTKLDMKIIEIVKINRELLRNLHIAGVRLDDTNYIDLYTEYRRMLSKREKVSYIVAALAVKYAISERKVYALIKRFQTDCNLFAV